MTNQSLTGRPVWDLQLMLLTISQQYPQIPPLIPDGVFGENTLEAVMVFQRDFHLPVTGVVDNATWDAITRQYHTTMRQIGPPIALRLLPSGTFTIAPGEAREQVSVIQAMFNSLARVLTNFETVIADGINQGVTLENTKRLQDKSGLPVTGIIDRPTWSYLARLYHLFVTRGTTP
jgi:peptidoglycan hydrolase-like protein with peptidoglycan-binding domain